MNLSKIRSRKWVRICAFLLIACVTAIYSISTFAAESSTDSSAINQDTTWTYLDTGADPAGDSSASGYSRTSWTKAGYDTSGWKTAKGSFGAKKGKKTALSGGYTPNTLLTQFKEDGSTDIEAYFFRTTVNIDDPSAIKKIEGSVLYDDSATVYINGTKVAGFDDSSITANLQYGGSNADAPQTGSISVTENIQKLLVKGDNVIAVEVHQGREGSSDIYFDMPSLTFSTSSDSEDGGSSSDTDNTISSISISVGSDETERNFTWYSNAKKDGEVLIAKASEVKNDTMPANATSSKATVKEATNKSGYYSYQATASKLEKNCKYAYQVVSGDAKSEINTFTTGSGSSFSFAFAGDPQIGASGSTVSDEDGWEKTLSLINSKSELSGIEFMLSAGDQVNRANDEDQYEAYLNHSTLKDLPVATVVGNHDTSSVAYDEHFNVPNKSSYGTTEASGDYYFVYNNTLFMALNSNNRSTSEHKAFMEEAISKTKNQNIKWKIVTFHHSIYSVANHASESDILERRSQLSPVFKDLDIDVVLMGHDHVYCRTYMMDGVTPMTDASIYDDDNYSSITNPEGILYVTANSASGSKYYTIQKDQDFNYAYVMNQERTPNISRVDISDNKFTITTYRTSDMSVVDTFTINRKTSHKVTVSDSEHGSASTDTTSAYSGDKVTLTATADDGYQFKEWKVVSGDVEISDDSFTMPDSDVEVQAVFEKIDSDDDGTIDDDSDDSDDVDDADDEDVTESTSNPSTGDNSLVLWITLALLAGGAASVVVIERKKASRH